MRTTDKLEVRVWRGNEAGGFTAYQVPRQNSQTVLDVVTHIQRHLEPSLSYRFACRVGMCGSCAMTVNGKARWTCRTHVDAVVGGAMLEIAPLNHLPIVRDLVVDMAPFFDKWAAAKGAFTLVNDVRDGAGIERLRAVGGDAGCQACHTHQSCTERCPKHLTPTASIAGLKRLVALAVVKRRL